MLDKDKDLRIDNQYYLKDKPVKIDFEKISGFLLMVREVLDRLDIKKIKDLRTKLKHSR